MKIKLFREQLDYLTSEELAKIKHTINNSPNLQCINSLSKKLLIATLSNEIHKREVSEVNKVKEVNK